LAFKHLEKSLVDIFFHPFEVHLNFEVFFVRKDLFGGFDQFLFTAPILAFEVLYELSEETFHWII
jgi:hypothetical protein